MVSLFVCKPVSLPARPVRLTPRPCLMFAIAHRAAVRRTRAARCWRRSAEFLETHDLALTATNLATICGGLVGISHTPN